jgi:hypothetical protein
MFDAEAEPIANLVHYVLKYQSTIWMPAGRPIQAFSSIFSQDPGRDVLEEFSKRM